jgi:hypothetical protein
MAKSVKPIEQTIDELKELLEYQDKVLGTADKLLKTKDHLIEILELQQEVYITENKILRVICLSFVALGFIIGAVKIVSLIL